jgi:hypothetical protein
MTPRHTALAIPTPDTKSATNPILHRGAETLYRTHNLSNLVGELL